jgi:HEAT repeat protein
MPAQIDDSLIDVLIAELAEERSRDTAQSATLLAKTIEATPEKELLRVAPILLESPDSMRRILGSRFLRELKDHRFEAADYLGEALLRETDIAVLEELTAAIGFTGAPFVWSKLRSLVDHPTPQVRFHLATAISASFSDGLTLNARDALLLLSRDEDPQVRYSAVFELASLRKAQIIRDPMIEARLLELGEGDSSPTVRNAARGAFDEDE